MNGARFPDATSHIDAEQLHARKVADEGEWGELRYCPRRPLDPFAEPRETGNTFRLRRHLPRLRSIITHVERSSSDRWRTCIVCDHHHHCDRRCHRHTHGVDRRRSVPSRVAHRAITGMLSSESWQNMTGIVGRTSSGIRLHNLQQQVLSPRVVQTRSFR